MVAVVGLHLKKIYPKYLGLQWFIMQTLMLWTGKTVSIVTLNLDRRLLVLPHREYTSVVWRNENEPLPSPEVCACVLRNGVCCVCVCACLQAPWVYTEPLRCHFAYVICQLQPAVSSSLQLSPSSLLLCFHLNPPLLAAISAATKQEISSGCKGNPKRGPRVSDITPLTCCSALRAAVQLVSGSQQVIEKKTNYFTFLRCESM